MKVSKNHYDIILKAMLQLPKNEILKHIETVKNKGNYKNLLVRIAFDCFWACNLNETFRDFDYNDKHMETAIIKAFKNLNIKI
jgi:hypothetical protein